MGTEGPAGGRARRARGTSSSGDVELRLPADVRHVGLARLVVSAAARQAGMAADRLEDLKIAVSEATTNAIRAHERTGLEQPVVLRFGQRNGRAFEVTVVDAGPGFDPPKDGSVDLADWAAREEGGLGVTLIRGLTDTCDFVADAGMQVNMRFAVGLESEL